MHGRRILIIIPCFNERENIGSLLEKLLSLYPEAEVLVVDDSSPDGTAEAARGVQARHPERVHVLQRAGKGGRGSAVLEGFRFALVGAYDLILEMDADFSHRPEEVADLIGIMEHYDCAVGSRYLPGARIEEWGWKRTLFSKWANRYARLVLGIPLTDYTNGFRCYRREAIAALDLSRIDAKGYVVLSEVAYHLYQRGMRLGEVPTVFINRRRGISNLSHKEIHEAFLSILRIRFHRKDP